MINALLLIAGVRWQYLWFQSLMMCFFNVYMSVIDYLDSSINYCPLTIYINQLFGVDKIFFLFRIRKLLITVAKLKKKK